MRKVKWLFAVLSFIIVFSTPVVAQDVPASEIFAGKVGFIVDNSLDTLSPNSANQQVGTSRLASIFRELDYEPVTIDLDEPISETVDVIVIIRPTTALTLRESAYLFEFLQSGKNLLVAFDPNGYRGIRSESARSVFNSLLLSIYGIQLEDNIMVEDWFTYDSLRLGGVDSFHTLVQPDNVPVHPIVLPLVQHDLPIHTWAARSLDVEPFSVLHVATSLAYTDTMYGETQTARSRFNGDPLLYEVQRNIGDDFQGRLPLAAVAVDVLTGSRLALIGDSELFQNDYGLSFRPEPNNTQPTYLANFLLAERTAAWLLNLPFFQWPGLPDGYTWIALDGNLNDWNEVIHSSTSDVVFDQFDPSLDIELVRAAHNDHFLYLGIEMADNPNQQAALSISIADENNIAIEFVSEHGQLYIIEESGSTTRVTDGDLNYDEDIEIRIPLRNIARPASILSLCVSLDGTQADCLEESLLSTVSGTVDPSPLRIVGTPLAVVRTPDFVNLREGPGTNFDVVAALDDGTVLSVVGIDANGDWLKVQIGGFEGWVFRQLAFVNAPIENLPVISE